MLLKMVPFKGTLWGTHGRGPQNLGTRKASGSPYMGPQLESPHLSSLRSQVLGGPGVAIIVVIHCATLVVITAMVLLSLLLTSPGPSSASYGSLVCAPFWDQAPRTPPKIVRCVVRHWMCPGGPPGTSSRPSEAQTAAACNVATLGLVLYFEVQRRLKLQL